jgi:hypothetical protein
VKKTPFRDVPDQSPYAEAIRTLARLGFIKGYEGSVFKPDQSVTRAEALKMLMSTIKCENCQSPSTETKVEYDPSKQSFDEFVKFHDQAGFYTPASDIQLPASKKFAFTEEELSGLLPSIGSYFDVRVEDWYYYCVEIATKLGLVHGYRGIEEGKSALGKFIPTRGVNIAELAKMVVLSIGQQGKKSEKVYGTKDGWWNDPKNNYLARAEEDLKLFRSEDAYRNPLRQATRAEVAYAAYQVLKAKGELDLDQDGVLNSDDQCPCQAQEEPSQDGCPAFGAGLLGQDLEEMEDTTTTPRESFEPRVSEDFFSGIEITQFLTCKCLALVQADLYPGSTFFAVITGRRENEQQIYVKSNAVKAP